MKHGKSLVLIVFLMAVVTVISGCWMSCEKYVAKRYAKNHPDFGKPDLGGIVLEGEYTSCNSDNLLKFEGYYKTLDEITLVFKASSPIDGKMCKRYAETHYNAFLQGVIYKRDLFHKYVTYQFEPGIFAENGREVHVDRAKIRFFRFPLSDDEPESYYSVNLRDYRNHGIAVVHRTQRDVVEQSYWTDYKYDELVQCYDADTDDWNEEILKDQYTNYMPLE